MKLCRTEVLKIRQAQIRLAEMKLKESGRHKLLDHLQASKGTFDGFAFSAEQTSMSVSPKEQEYLAIF